MENEIGTFPPKQWAVRPSWGFLEALGLSSINVGD